jgi:hypothetical protein
MANTDICLSRKAARGPGYHERCPNKKRTDSNYCGKHTTTHTDYIPVLDTLEPNNEHIVHKDITGSNETGETSETSETIKTVKTKKLVRKPRVYTNTTDFYTLDSIEDIPQEYFYDYEEGGLFYAFDIRTLYDYLQSCNPLEGYKNPYTQLAIPEERIEDIKKAYKKLQKRGLPVDNYKEDIHISPEWRCLGIFQKINELGHYSEYKWFWNLNLQGLKRMYMELEDLWNYRIYLTPEQKQQILPKYRPFRNVTVQQFSIFTSIEAARTILMDEIERFITMGRPEGKNGNDNKYTGSIFVLTALVEVSPMAASVMPHLVPMV